VYETISFADFNMM